MTPKERRKALIDLLTELACDGADELSTDGVADEIEKLFSVRCPKCASTKIGLKRTIIGYFKYCRDCSHTLEII